MVTVSKLVAVQLSGWFAGGGRRGGRRTEEGVLWNVSGPFISRHSCVSVYANWFHRPRSVKLSIQHCIQCAKEIVHKCVPVSASVPPVKPIK